MIEQHLTPELKRAWKEIEGRAVEILNFACPRQSTALKSAFIATALQTNVKRIKRIKNLLAKGSRVDAAQVIGDWFRLWNSDEARLKRAANTADADEADWAVQKKNKKEKEAKASGAEAAKANAAASLRQKKKTAPPKGEENGRDRKDKEGSNPWRENRLCEKCPLIDRGGDDVDMLCLDDSPCIASGWLFCTCDFALRQIPYYAESHFPVTFILPPYPNFKEDVMRGLEKVKADTDGVINAVIEEASVFVVDEAAHGGRRAQEVLLLQVNAANPLRPPQADHDGMLFTSTLPTLVWDAPKEVEMQLTVAAPLCKELGMEKWWDKFAAIPFPRYKDELKKLVESPKRKLPFLRVKRDRTLRWRGENIEDGCQVAWFRVPEDEVSGILAKSGKDGLLFDVAKRGDEREELKKINLPSEWTLADALRKIAELEKAHTAVKAA